MDKIYFFACRVYVQQRTAACDEPFGRELRVEKLRVERLSRIEYRKPNIE
jgi:hypothetical protein